MIDSVSESLSGILPIDKPTGMTSHDVVDVIRKLYGIRRVGHTGTLDPAASGLLLMVVGRATRIASYVSGQDKTYHATVDFGKTSDSGDRDGTVTDTGQSPPSREQLNAIVTEFVGDVELELPAISAVRTEGRRRYEIARSGKTVPTEMRTSTIHSIEILAYDPPRAEMRVHCASGTYIRSLAQAMGEKVGCGALLAGLRRESVGRATVGGAYGLDYLAARHALGEELPEPEPIDRYLDLPTVEVVAAAADVIRHGQQFTAALVIRTIGEFAEGDDVAISVQGYGVASIGKIIGPIGQIGPILSYQCVLI